MHVETESKVTNMSSFENQQKVGIAFIGCGYVADYYVSTLPNHPHLNLVGVWDHDAERLKSFAEYHDLPTLNGLNDILENEEIRLVINLTNPKSHYDLNKAALLAGKHVYCEKPLALEWHHALELYELAQEQGLFMISAPCSVLWEQAQTLAKAIRDEIIGPIHLIQAKIDEGMTHQMAYRRWQSPSGRFWPWKDEFEVGCTLEHAGYYVTWLTAILDQLKK